MTFNKKNYWQGPANIMVPNYIDEVPCLDNVNTMIKSGSCTELGGPFPNPYTVKSYRQKFAEYKDGQWIWKTTEIYDVDDLDDPDESTSYHEITNFWQGPFDILIPNYIPRIPGPNGGFYDRDDGPQFTNPGPITRNCEKVYKEKYAEFNQDDNKWYWD